MLVIGKLKSSVRLTRIKMRSAGMPYDDSHSRMTPVFDTRA